MSASVPCANIPYSSQIHHVHGAGAHRGAAAAAVIAFRALSRCCVSVKCTVNFAVVTSRRLTNFG